jgi:hypothetical protein
MTERADFLVNNRSPRYLHGFQKDTNETTELPHTVPVDNQVTYTDSFTNYGVDTVYGKEYVIAAGSSPTVHNSLPGRSDSGTHPASSISNTPAGNIAATTVQAALNELDSEKGGLALNNSWSGTQSFTNTTTSRSSTTGAAIFSGGIGASGSIYSGNTVGSDVGSFVCGTTTRAGGSVLAVRSRAGFIRQVLFETGGTARWSFRVGGAPEGGSDAGSDFTIRAFTDAGGLVDDALSIARAAGGFLSSPRPTRLTNSTASTSTTTGALVVTGGIASGDGIFAGGRITGAATASATGSIFAQPPATTLTSGTIAAFRADLLANPASASSAINIGARSVTSTASGNAQNFTSYIGLNGFFMAVTHNGTGTVTGENGIVAFADNGGSGTVTNLAGAMLNVRNLGTGTVTSAYGVRVTSLVNSGGGTVGTNYGVFVEGQTAGTVNYSIYTNAGLVRLGGKTSIADTTASISTTTGALVVTGGVGCGDYFTGKYRSSDGTAGLTATRTFYAASSSGGATNVLNTVTIKDGIITSWTQA